MLVRINKTQVTSFVNNENCYNLQETATGVLKTELDRESLVLTSTYNKLLATLPRMKNDYYLRIQMYQCSYVPNTVHLESCQALKNYDTVQSLNTTLVICIILHIH